MSASSIFLRLTTTVCLVAVTSIGYANPKASLLFSGFQEELGLPPGIGPKKVQAMRWIGVSLDPCEIIDTGIRLEVSDMKNPTLDVKVVATTRPEFNGFFVNTLSLKAGPFDCVTIKDPAENFVGYYQVDPPPGSTDNMAYDFKSKATLIFNDQAGTLELVRESKQITVVLIVGQQRQSLAVFPTGIEAAGFNLFDIDRDGRVDVLCSYQTAIESGFSVLYLSSLSAPGKIVGEAATQPK